MKLMLTLDPQLAKRKIAYSDTLLLMGSCFSDNVGVKLQEVKFNTLFNPTGIVFDPLSVAQHLSEYVSGKQYEADELFQRNELWHSWFHHSAFSSPSQALTLLAINEAIAKGRHYLQTASHLFITLGTAFSYTLKEGNITVANCHKAPKEWFDKELLTISNMVTALQNSIRLVRELNPTLQIVFTVSPVKHIRDGIIENSRSKARLLEAVNTLVAADTHCSYFPAYELVTDVLRDYRFYAGDMAHPNMQAIDFVFDHFCQTYFDTATMQLVQEIKQIATAKSHKVLHPNTTAHHQFLETFLAKTEAMERKLPQLNWQEELNYFKK